MHNRNDSNRSKRAYRDPYQEPNIHHRTDDQLSRRVPERDRTLQDERTDYRLINRTPVVANGTRTSQADVSYRNGYAQGRGDRYYLEQVGRARDNESSARGFLLGILLTSLVGIVIAAIFFVSQQNQTPVPVVPVPSVDVPDAPESSEPPANTNTEVRERIIERTRELVPVPQPQSPAADEQPNAPVPSQSPVVEQSPSQLPSPTAPSPTVQPEAQSSEPVLPSPAPATDG